MDKSLRLIRAEGLYHPSLHTREIAGNPDARFRFANIDDQYRMVVVVEGDDVLFERAGNHDDVLTWGAGASLREYRDRLAIDPADYLAGIVPASHGPGGANDAKAAPSTLFGEETTLPQILERRAELSDLIVGDIEGALAGYRDGTIEDWMIFLSPLQRRAIDRAMDGPSRVTGGPGTGKTVVGLHLAAQFARAADHGLTRPPYELREDGAGSPEGLFERLDPATVSRVEASSIHRLAGKALARRGIAAHVDDEASRKPFDQSPRA